MKIISSHEVMKTKLFRIVEELATDPDGFEIHRYIVRHPGSAVMMPVDESGRILLTRQFRLPAEHELWELPAGRIDPGETPLQAARRELREETGYEAEEWDPLISFWATPGYVDEKMTVFVATKLSAGKQQTMEDERITTQWFDEEDLGDMIRSGQIVDAKTMIGYFVYRDRRAKDSATRS